MEIPVELAGAVDIDPAACRTLCANRPAWKVIEGSIAEVSSKDFRGTDLLAGGVPCPPFSITGKQRGRRQNVAGGLFDTANVVRDELDARRGLPCALENTSSWREK